MGEHLYGIFEPAVDGGVDDVLVMHLRTGALIGLVSLLISSRTNEHVDGVALHRETFDVARAGLAGPVFGIGQDVVCRT